MRGAVQENILALGLEALFLSFLCFAPGLAAQELPPPGRQVSFDGAFRGKYIWVIPKWHNGYAVNWKHDPSPYDQKEDLVVYDRDGKLFGQARLWLEGAGAVRITDADVRSDGTVAAVGWATPDGGNFQQYLAEVSMPSGTVHVIQTTPFDGRAVTFAPDGTIWVLGLESGGPERSVAKAPDHFMIKHFGTDGLLKGQYVLRSEFSCEWHPALAGNRAQPQIQASADRIGFFAPVCLMWAELSPDGKWLGGWRWKGKPFGSQDPDSTFISNVTLTSTNELYASMDSHPLGAVILVRFDRESSTWIPVNTSAATAAEAPFGYLEGTDGDSLVYLTSGKRFIWAKPQSTP